MKSLLSEGVPWAASLLLSLRPWFGVGFLLIVFGQLLFQPMVRTMSRVPLLNLLGMTYGDMSISVWRLKLVIKRMELRPSQSFFARAAILAIVPSAHVRQLDDSVDRPESKVTVERLSIKIRVNSLAAQEERDCGDAPRGLAHAACRLLPRPTLMVRLGGVSIDIEKAYLAPEPPPRLRVPARGRRPTLPAALPPANGAGNLPTFFQDDLLQTVRDEEAGEADCVTSLMERWVDHVVTKTKGVAAVESHDSNKEESPGTLTADEKSPEKQQTYAERANEWISWGADIALHSVLFEIRKLTVTISGVDSKTFKEAHKTLSPNEANVMFARLPRHRRALTVFGADVISLSFSPCDQCNALLCCVGLHTKVGMPALFDQPEGDAVTPPVSIDLEYAWHMITHLRDLAVEVKGTKDIITWASNYDHYWHTKRCHLSFQ